jgi:hypothetical protein
MSTERAPKGTGEVVDAALAESWPVSADEESVSCAEDGPGSDAGGDR